MKIRNINRLLIIFSLFEGKKHGYEIMNELEDKTGKRPSASQVYPFLRKLKENDLVQVEEKGQRGKKIYSLTKEGRKFVGSVTNESVQFYVEHSQKQYWEAVDHEHYLHRSQRQINDYGA